MLDAPTLRRAIGDLFRFNPKQFFVQGSATSFLISLVPKASASGGEQITYGFQWYPAPLPDEGPAPDNQGRLIKLQTSSINSSVVPDNMDSVFELEDNKANYLLCTTNQNSDGIVQSAELSVVQELHVDPEGSPGVAPATSSRALWCFTVEDGKIKSKVALRIGGIDVTPVVVGMECQSVTLRMFWGPAQNTVVLQNPDK